MDSFALFLKFLENTGAVWAIAIVFFFGVPTVSHHWYKLRVKQWEMSLKHTMLERGLSADEIKTVLEASTMDGEKKIGYWSRRQHAGTNV